MSKVLQRRAERQKRENKLRRYEEAKNASESEKERARLLMFGAEKEQLGHGKLGKYGVEFFCYDDCISVGCGALALSLGITTPDMPRTPHKSMMYFAYMLNSFLREVPIHANTRIFFVSTTKINMEMERLAALMGVSKSAVTATLRNYIRRAQAENSELWQEINLPQRPLRYYEIFTTVMRWCFYEGIKALKITDAGEII